ncbi:CAP domain-containing protein [Thermohalobacter berrensis]|uniref:SCP-like extracellular protein n=1 Tax=Thermohalobacter berrensis TaxID=99594 RepID=A0A419T6C5_9FIRM|nr:CAP domain-containing protein [Thermohalobacter berrensis]RKD32965.1 SCP-like extracellular protein [Thermohalobacter berrensis]
MNKRTILAICISFILIFAVSCANPQERPRENAKPKQSSIFEAADVKNVRITADRVNIRTGNGNNFPVIGKLSKNQRVKVIGELKDWYVVQSPDNSVGCIPSNQAKPIVVDDNQGNNQQNEMAEQREEAEERRMGNPEEEQDQRQVGRATRLKETEQQMVNLINQERTKRNLPPLKVDLELTKVARLKSQDMVENNYFSHNSPTYGSPFEMMDQFGIEYLYAGENIAANSSIQNAHTSLMNSQGHRRNILNENFTHVGIGVAPSDRYGYMITQMFISKPK